MTHAADNTPPSNVRTPRRWWNIRTWSTRSKILALLFYVVYPLSIGPMFWTWHSAVYANGSVLIVIFYLPLLALSEYFPPFRFLINVYINLWILGNPGLGE